LRTVAIYEFADLEVTFARLAVMAQIQTSRIRRTWLEKLFLWQRAYQTKILDAQREFIGRGHTPEASLKLAERRWQAELQRRINRVPSHNSASFPLGPVQPQAGTSKSNLN
jgi:hypothetical protein